MLSQPREQCGGSIPLESAVHGIALVAGLLLVYTVLRDAFETIVLPRRPVQRRRITTLFYRLTWPAARALHQRLPGGAGETVLNYFGSLWILGLIAVWTLLLQLAFGFVYYGLGSHLAAAGTRSPDFLWDLYASGTTLFTLGMGDIYPANPFTRLAAVFEAGLGLALLALVIAYVPVLYSAFSRREVLISMLDARAGSPPTASELLRRSLQGGELSVLLDTLAQFERWGAELLESYLSYPVLMYYRSQHDRQSWLAVLVAVMDACAVLMAAGDSPLRPQAGYTFAIMRHTVVDVVPFVGTEEKSPDTNRLTAAEREELLHILSRAGIEVADRADFDARLDDIRASYEALVTGLEQWLLMPLPRFAPLTGTGDDWQDQPGLDT